MADLQGQQGGDPLHQAVALRPVTAADEWAADEDRFYDVKVEWFPIPVRANPLEGTVWKFKEKVHGTRVVLADLLMRVVFLHNNYVGDKRREILHLLPVKNKHEQEQLKRLTNELNGLEAKLTKKLADFNSSIANLQLRFPDHFASFPKLD